MLQTTNGDGFLTSLDFGGIKMKRLFFRRIKNFQKSILLLICFSTLLSACSLFTIECHHPTILTNSFFLFEDLSGNSYFSIPQHSGVFKHSLNARENYLPYYEDVYSNIVGEGHCNLVGMTSNASFLILNEKSSLKDSNHSRIEIFDKSLSLYYSFTTNPSIWITDIECTENYLYFTVYYPENSYYSLERCRFIDKETTVLLENVLESTNYIDDDASLTLNVNNGQITFVSEKNSKKTKMIVDENNHSIYSLSRNLELTISESKVLTVNNNGCISSFPFDYDVNMLYGQPYIIEDNVLFACYEYKPDSNCLIKDYTIYPSTCICGLKKSYLFSLDAAKNTLSLIKDYPNGAFLIDYDLNGAMYYYNGKLILYDQLSRECEVISPGKIDKFNVFNEYRPSQAHKTYFLSFNNNTFFGI